jgi:transcriptional regulator with XRE-family HTH domain
MFKPQFHTLLRERRKESGLTQKQAAEACRIEPDRWSQLERGRRFPSERELIVIGSFLKLGPVFVAPCKATKQLLDNGARLAPPVKPFFVPQDRVTHSRYRKLMARQGALARALEERLWCRPDFPLCQQFSHKVRCDSYLESLYLMCRMFEGTTPSLVEPARFEPTPLPIVDPRTRKYVGARPHLCLTDGKTYDFIQASFFGPIVHRVDILRWEGRWRVIELDGEGHSTDCDAEREKAIALPTTRLKTADVVRFGWDLVRRAA